SSHTPPRSEGGADRMTSGNRREELERLRDVLWVSLESAPVEKRAPLAGQLRQTLRELDELTVGNGDGVGDEVQEGNGLVDFQSRLAQRQSGAYASRRSSR